MTNNKLQILYLCSKFRRMWFYQLNTNDVQHVRIYAQSDNFETIFKLPESKIIDIYTMQTLNILHKMSH